MILPLREKIKKCFDISGLREFTVECNPGTVDLEKLEALQQAGKDPFEITLAVTVITLERLNKEACRPAGMPIRRMFHSGAF